MSTLLKSPYTPKRPGSRKFALPLSEWLSKESPTTTDIPADDFLLPTSRVCHTLESLLQSQKGEINSVQHPTNERAYLPLWILPIWKAADEMLKMQQFWHERLLWIERTAKAENWREDLLHSTMECV